MTWIDYAAAAVIVISALAIIAVSTRPRRDSVPPISRRAIANLVERQPDPGDGTP